MSEKDAAEGTPSPIQQQTTEVVVDDSGTLPSYSNFCRVTATPEEVILDFGLNPQPFASGRQEVKANQRIVMNFYTAKRLLTALGMTTQRHEQTFGAIELDVRDGFITRIDGGFDAKYLRKHLESYNDPAAFGIAHVGWGLHPKASWGALGLRDKVQSHGMDSRSFAGNFLLSTGPNAEAGGSNHSPCHIDIPMADCSVSLDGEPMTVDGVLVAPDQRLPA